MDCTFNLGVSSSAAAPALLLWLLARFHSLRDSPDLWSSKSLYFIIFSILLLFIWYELVCALFGMGPVLCPPGILKSVSFLLHGRYVKLPVPLKSLTPPACLSPSENAGHHLSNPLASCTQTLNVPAATSPPLLSRGGAVPTPSLPGHNTQSHHRMSILPQRWPGEPGPVISE